MKRQLDKLIADYNSLLPLQEKYRKELDKKFRLEFNFNSNHLEGNTLTYGETKLLLLFDQTKGTHEMREYEEMKAHDVALAMIKEEVCDKEKPLTERFIKELNEIILVRPFWKDAETQDGMGTRRIIKVGEYKEHPNSVRLPNGELFEYASPQEVPILMAELLKWYNNEVEKGELSAIELAALLHYRFIRIHPFDDGNGRVARLLVNFVLYKNDLPPVIIKSLEKKDYLRALQQADAGDLQAFIDYMSQQLAWSLDLTILASRGESIEEEEDWEKQLTLLKKGLGDKSGDVVRKSEESVKNVFDNVVVPFAKKVESKLIAFESLFMKHEVILHVDDYKIVENTLGLEIDRYKKYCAGLIYAHYGTTEYLQMEFIFSNLRKPLVTISISTSLFGFIFDQNAYSIQWCNNQISKLYSEVLSDEEMNSIVSNIAKDLMQRIETTINENECKK